MTFDDDAWQSLWDYVAEQYPLKGDYSIHGPDHWRRVLMNARQIAAHSGADPEVIQLFALFHDSRRENEGHDPEHGARGAILAAELRGKLFELEDTKFAILQYACRWHTKGKHHADPTIGTCWDADRLDLGRVGVTPRAEFMSTAHGRWLADRIR